MIRVPMSRNIIIIPFLVLAGCSRPALTVSLRDECLQTLYVLTDALLELQIKDTAHADHGALYCSAEDILHTRAAEAVYPFAVAYKHSGRSEYLNAARSLGNWLIQQQFPGGEWKETPEEWTGTSTDQLLMMVLAFPIIADHLDDNEKAAWEKSIRGAADYLTKVMSPDFASINYCATTMASLAMTSRTFPDQRYVDNARELAFQVHSKMDEDGFINAEGDRVYGIKYGADVGYEIDMSLWGMALYARLTEDEEVMEAVRQSLESHLTFIYPNGVIDGSWGIRSNKWTTYGSQTADGCQILFSLFASEDARYRTAAFRNLEYLRGMMKDGIIGYGPHYWDLFDTPPCIYPTFVRSKNLAMAVELGEQEPGEMPPLPTEEPSMVRYFPTVDVVVARSENILATITAYRYKELRKRFKSKYMHRPTGGSISNLWVTDHGLLQLSSQTEYHRWEPMHFPDIDSTYCLTPRIEFTNENGYFTNLYNFDGSLSLVPTSRGSTVTVRTTGELMDRNLLPGGIAYSLEHSISDRAIDKRVELRFHGSRSKVRLVEPIVEHPGMTFKLLDERTVEIQGEKRAFRFKVLEGNARLLLGEHEDRYWAVFPSVKAYPIVLEVEAQANEFSKEIRYRISII